MNPKISRRVCGDVISVPNEAWASVEQGVGVRRAPGGHAWAPGRPLGFGGKEGVKKSRPSGVGERGYCCL